MTIGFSERIAGGLVAAAVMTLVSVGCGGSGGSSSSEESTQASDSNPSAEFLGKRLSTNEKVEFGREADDSEREQASKILAVNLKARASGDWKTQCASMSKGAVKETEKRGAPIGGESKSCTKSLAFLAQPPARTKPFRVDTMTGPIDVLRVKGNEGFALYHGNDGVNYAMAMEKEGGEWKVASITTRTLR
jgi:hypothetical protein